jgi:hypothetical protein
LVRLLLHLQVSLSFNSPLDEARNKNIGDRMAAAIKSVYGSSYRSVRAREFWPAAGILRFI